MYAFGDYDCVTNQSTAKEIEKYLKTIWIPKIQHSGTTDLDEEFVKRIYALEIEHFKKKKNTMKEVDNFEDKQAEYDISFIPKEDLDEKLYLEDSSMNGKQEEDKESDMSIDSKEEENKIEDFLYEERTSYYSELVEKMDEIQYDTFSK